MDTLAPSLMNAFLQPAYGLPDVLRHAQVPRPAVPDDGVLVRVVAAGLNKADWIFLTGKPYLSRLAFGLTRPTRPIPGMAMAGRVEAVGAKVASFRVGDEVFGETNRGGLAEYVCVSETELAKKPPEMTFEQAATLPVAATTALQGLRDAGRLVAGQSVLVNGAAGGVGTFAVQIAKAMGAEVTAVCSTGNIALVRSLGADHVIDYTQEDFTAGDRRYDVIFDLVGNHSVGARRRVLKENGRLVSSAGGAENAWMGPMPQILAGMAGNLVSKQAFVALVAKPNQADLETVAAWVRSGQVRPVIDRRYSLVELPEAMRYLGEGGSRGKSVVTL